MKKIEKQLQILGRTIRFTNFIDEQSESFENRADFMAEAAIEQTVTYLKRTHRDFFLLQIAAKDGSPLMQACVYVGCSKLLPFAMATASNLHHAKDLKEEEFGLKILSELCSQIPEIMTLRLQPKRFADQMLNDFETLAKKQGYEPTSPLGPTRTLLLDLCASSEELYASLPQKTRAKIRHASREKAIIRPITEPKFIDICQAAATASRKRTGSYETQYDFEGTFALAKAHPDRAHIVGIFLKDQPETLLAYVIGFKNGSYCEYSSAGGFGDPALRSMPYNYFLMWDLINWARAVGCVKMDMGGVTEGSENDPLQGISRFKRSITQKEVEIGREMSMTLKPLRFFLYRNLKRLSNFSFESNKLHSVATHD